MRWSPCYIFTNFENFKDTFLMSSKSSQPKASSKPNGNKKNGASGSKAVSIAAAQGSQFINRAPVMRSGSNGSMVVSHCERFSQINGSVAFTNTSFSVNPGLVSNFPWLANIANRYEKYRFRRLQVYFRTKCANTFVGDVSMGIDYDAADGVAASSMQLENYSDAVNGPPWADLVMRCSNVNLQSRKEWFCRSGSLASNLDVKSYDVGLFQFATEGQAGTNLVGYLYWDYEVEFFTPQLSFDDLLLGGSVVGAGSFAAGTPLGSAAVLDPSSRGISLSASTITLQYPGTYVVSWRLTATAVGGTMTVTGSTGVTVSTLIATVNDAGALTGTQVVSVVSTVQNGTIAFTVNTLTTGTAAYVSIGSAPASSLA